MHLKIIWMQTWAYGATTINLKIHHQQVELPTNKRCAINSNNNNNKSNKENTCIKRAYLFTAIKCGPYNNGVAWHTSHLGSKYLNMSQSTNKLLTFDIRNCHIRMNFAKHNHYVEYVCKDFPRYREKWRARFRKFHVIMWHSLCVTCRLFEIKIVIIQIQTQICSNFILFQSDDCLSQL